MRALKIMAALVLLGVAGFLVSALVVFPAYWYPNTRRESVKVLEAASSPADLTKAVGALGLFVPLTNGGWIAIRYNDLHSGGIQSCAVARDSGGGWFESDRHFCGSLSAWPHLKDQVAAAEAIHKINPEFPTNHLASAEDDNGMFPSYREMMAMESAPDLETARRALQKIGFKPLEK